MGILGYADDVTLRSPSIRSLNIMLSICEEVSKEYFIKFNSEKSMCIKYGEKYDCEKSQLNQETIIWVNSVKHIGNIINNDLNDIDLSVSLISYIVIYIYLYICIFDFLQRPLSIRNL